MFLVCLLLFFCYSVVTRDLADISDCLYSIVSKTDAKEKVYNLGIRLGLSAYTVQNLRRSAVDSNDYLHQVITAWLRNEDHARSQTWHTLIIALLSKGVKEEGLAREIAENKGLQSLLKASPTVKFPFMFNEHGKAF